MKRHVLEIASDARTLEEKLNSLGDHLTFETMVWANGKLFVVVRECSPRRRSFEESPTHEANSYRSKRRDKKRESPLPRPGESLRKKEC